MLRKGPGHISIDPRAIRQGAELIGCKGETVRLYVVSFAFAEVDHSAI